MMNHPLSTACSSSAALFAMTRRLRLLRDSGRRWQRGLLAVLVLIVTATSVEAAPRVLSVEEFNRTPKSGLVGKELAVQGRLALVGKNRLKLKRCEMNFEAPAGLPPLIRRSPDVEVSGRVVNTEGRFQFIVSHIRATPTDLQRYEEKRRAIRVETAEAWYELAAWAQGRGEFYDDAALLERSAEARRRGFQIERRRLTREDPATPFALARRVEELGLGTALQQELLHEGYVQKFRTLNDASPAEYRQLAEEIAAALPGCREPLEPLPEELKSTYDTDPFGTYTSADAEKRRTLHRLLWIAVMQKAIESDAAEDGSNGFEIAARLDEQLPELHPLAETYRDRALKLRAEKVANLPLPEVLALRQQYADRDQVQQGDAVVESWLALRLRQLPADDTEGLLDLAEKYRTLLKRPERAARLLFDAYQRHPDSPIIAARIEELGYRRKGNRWLTQEEFDAVPEGRLEQALREGRVENGMTADQVLKSLGKPGSVTRFASSSQISEIWSYQRAGGLSLTVYLVRRLPQTETLVVGIGQLDER